MEYVERKLDEISRNLMESFKLVTALKKALLKHCRRNVMACMLLEIINLVIEDIIRSNRILLDISEYLKEEKKQ